jgi:hypothetical protein|tara:strand:+ start:1098 stop:1895 length:798 start_codon:yes stop_codon:yes gene_type:complete
MSDFDAKREYTREEMEALFAGPRPNRKPIPIHVPTDDFTETPEFQEQLKKHPLAKLGLKGLDRGRAKIFERPVDDLYEGMYIFPAKDISDKDMIKIMLGQTPNMLPPSMEITARHHQASDPASVRDSVSLNTAGLPNKDLSKTTTLLHEFRHRALNILKEKHGIEVEKHLNIDEEILMRVMDYLSPDYPEGPKAREVAEVKAFNDVDITKVAKDPKVLAFIVHVQDLAQQELLAFAEKMVKNPPKKDDGLEYTPEQEEQMKKEGR